MERRGFIKGLLAAVAGGEALVRLATPGEAAALTVGQTALVGQPALGVEAAPHGSAVGQFVFMQRGQGYVPIGILTYLEMRVRDVDLTSWHGNIQVSGPGLMEAVAEFEGPFPRPTARRLR